MIAIIIVVVVVGIGLVAFLLRKYIPGLHPSDDNRKSRHDIAKENVEKMVVDPEHDITSITEQEALKKHEIKKIQRKAKTDEEETKMLVESHVVDHEDEAEDETK